MSDVLYGLPCWSTSRRPRRHGVRRKSPTRNSGPKDPRALRLRSPPAPPDEEDERRHDRVSDAAHERNRLPSSRQSTISAGIATNQVTSPSGTGPRKPSPQPPGRAGFFVNST